MVRLLAVGELLIDFTPTSVNGQKGFIQNPGGAPCNMLAMAQAMGVQTAFVGKVGNDQFGLHLKETLEAKSVDTRNLILSEDFNTTLAFVHLTPEGDRSFSFYRKGCADVNLTEADVDWNLLDSVDWVHFGSLSFTDDPSKTTVLKILERAKSLNKRISYDPNFRPALWPSDQAAVAGMKLGLSYANYLKVSDEEALLITGQENIESAAESLYERGIELVCVTLGAKGVYYHHTSGKGYVTGFESQVKDTTGAGDAFFGAAIAQLLQVKKPLDQVHLETILKKANAAASLVVEGYGGIPAIPSLKAVEDRFKA